MLLQAYLLDARKKLLCRWSKSSNLRSPLHWSSEDNNNNKSNNGKQTNSSHTNKFNNAYITSINLKNFTALIYLKIRPEPTSTTSENLSMIMSEALTKRSDNAWTSANSRIPMQLQGSSCASRYLVHASPSGVICNQMKNARLTRWNSPRV